MNQNIISGKQFFDLSIATASTAVEQAIKAGEYFSLAKSELPHGEFIPALESLGLSRRNVSNYMKLSKQLPNGQNLSHLKSIDSALEFLKAPEEVKEKISEMVEPVTASQIKDLTKELEAAKSEKESISKTSENWRNQWKDERDAKRSLETELTQAKANQSDVNIDEVIEQKTASIVAEKERLEAALFRANKAKDRASKDANEKIRTANIEAKEDIEKKVNAELTRRGESIEVIEKQIEVKREELSVIKNNVRTSEYQVKKFESIREHVSTVIFEIQDMFDSDNKLKVDGLEEEFTSILDFADKTITLARQFFSGKTGMNDLVNYMEKNQ